MTPKVSVIVPVYNVENYLRTCLDSIINQTLQEIEIICVDDGSTDNSLKILQEYSNIDKRFKIITQKNLFAGVARNTGMEIAQGEYYVFLDSDDFFELDLLEKEYEKCRMFNADICICGADKYDMIKKKYIKASNLLDLQYVNSEIFNRHTLKEHLYNVTTACPWTKMFSAKFIKQHKLTFQDLPRANDVFFVLSALGLAGRIVSVNEVLVHYRINNSKSLQSNNKKSPGVFLKALEAVQDKLDLDNADEKLKQAFSNVALGHLAYNLRSLEFDRAYEEFLQVKSIVKQYYLSRFYLNNKCYDYFFNKNDLQYLTDKDIIKLDKNDNETTIEHCLKEHVMISFIVPVYNSERYIRECINSIRMQTEKNIEILCIDDNSSDSSLSILNELSQIDSRMHIYSHARNKGAGGARNTGLNFAKGKYVWFVDADDFIDPDASEKLLNILEQYHDEIDLLGFNAEAFVYKNDQYIKSDGGIFRNWPQNEIIRLPRDQHKLPNSIEGSSVTYIAKRSLVNKYRFRESVSFEDADYSFKLYTSKANFFILDYAPYHRRITHSSTTGCNAMGLNVNCVYGRIYAAKAILYYINEYSVKLNYAINWYKNWSRWAIELYLHEEQFQNQLMDQIIQLLQKKLQIFSAKEVLFYKSRLLPKIVISLTTIPSRIQTVHLVIESLLRQTVQADKILLYIAQEQINKKNISKELLGLKSINPKFDIIFCEDLKPHKKYFYAIQEYPDSIVITVDDDIIYNNRLVEKLISSYVKFPYAVSCMRGHTIKIYDEETLAPYKKWQKEKKIVGIPSLLVLATGVGGVLYPPNCMSKLVFDIGKIRNVALFTDDLWLKWMQLKINTKCVLIKHEENLHYIDGSQNEALWLQNVNENKNDIAVKNILQEDSLLNVKNENILEKLFDEYERTCKCNNKELEFYKNELYNIKHGYSFRIGRVITFFPRKIRGGIRCYNEHGFKYTIKRTLYHVGLYKW